MSRINLREIYPFYREDCYVEVSDEIIDAIQEMVRKENAYARKVTRYNAYFSLDRNDAIEHEAVLISMTPEEYYEKKVTYEQLYKAMRKLSTKQATRIYACYFMDMSHAAIARSEGVRVNAVRKSIQEGLKILSKYFKDRN